MQAEKPKPEMNRAQSNWVSLLANAAAMAPSSPRSKPPIMAGRRPQWSAAPPMKGCPKPRPNTNKATVAARASASMYTLLAKTGDKPTATLTPNGASAASSAKNAAPYIQPLTPTEADFESEFNGILSFNRSRGSQTDRFRS